AKMPWPAPAGASARRRADFSGSLTSPPIAMRRPHIFILSPARCDGRRAQALLNPRAEFPLAVQLRQPEGATLGDVFAFLSGLYFRGKLTYARAFANTSVAAAP